MLDMFHLQHLHGNLTRNIKELLPYVGEYAQYTHAHAHAHACTKDVPEGKVNILVGHTIDHFKQKLVCHVTHFEWFLK
jgi:hypothetical protein